MEKIKDIIALLVLVASSYTDIKERQIYLLPLLVGGIASLALSIMICITVPVGETARSLLSMIIYPILFGLFVMVLIITTKGEIGMGDAYLSLVLGICIGVANEIRVLCISVVVAGLFCAGLICINKDKLWKRIPFVPFVLLGFMVMLINR